MGKSRYTSLTLPAYFSMTLAIVPFACLQNGHSKSENSTMVTAASGEPRTGAPVDRHVDAHRGGARGDRRSWPARAAMPGSSPGGPRASPAAGGYGSAAGRWPRAAHPGLVGIVVVVDLLFGDERHFGRHFRVEQRGDRHAALRRFLLEQTLRDERIDLIALERVDLLFELRELGAERALDVLGGDRRSR